VPAVILRLRSDRRDARRAVLSERWQRALLDAVAEPEKASTLHGLVAANRRLHFVGFVLEFARRMRGDEAVFLRTLVRPYLHLVAERFQSERMEVRARAVQTLGSLGLPDHEDLVIAALDDPSPLVAMVAARALAKEEEPRYAEPLLAKVHRFGDWNRPYLASMLAAMGPQVAPGLRRALADGHSKPWTRAVMAEALRLQGDFEAGDVAAEVLKTAEERDLVVAVLRLLADVGRPAHLPSLRALVTSHDGVVRAQALRALGRLGGEGDLPALVNALDDEFTWAALYAARGVRESGGRGILLDAAASESRRGRLALQVLEEEGAW
jgi:HEAT repeat protein